VYLYTWNQQAGTQARPAAANESLAAWAGRTATTDLGSTENIMTPLQLSAWNKPFLNGTEGPPERIEEPRKGWRVAMSINL